MQFPRSTRQDRRRAAPETVLVVDDVEDVAHTVGLILEEAGYRVLKAVGAEEAKRIAGQHAIDLLLTDVEMPGESGDALAAWFKAMNPRGKVLFMTGNPMKQLHLGLHRVLPKPFPKIDGVLEAVRRAVSEAERQHLATSAV